MVNEELVEENSTKQTQQAWLRILKPVTDRQRGRRLKMCKLDII